MSGEFLAREWPGPGHGGRTKQGQSVWGVRAVWVKERVLGRKSVKLGEETG